MSRPTTSSSRPLAGSAHTTVLLKNLRLLDLDEEFDYPSIQTNSFASTSPSSQHANRVRAAEWVLYKLLSIWDATSIEHLSRYFPALEPKQSKELRAGLFKTLSEIKNKGTFHKDIVVRRTMLEECKGPKLEELLGCLSSMALTKATVGNKGDGSVSKKAALGDYDGKAFQPALGLAYRYDCSKTLRQREAYEKRWQKFGRSLRSHKEELEVREKDIESTSRQRKEKVIPQRTLHRLKRHVHENWKGDQEWVDVLLRSDQHRSQGRLLERDFDNVWRHACEDTLYSIRPQRNDSLLQDLEHRVGQQNSRLEKWRAIRERLMIQAEAMVDMEEEAQDTPPAIESTSTLGDWTSTESSKSSAKSTYAREKAKPLDQLEYTSSPLTSSNTAYSPSKVVKTPSATDSSLSYIPPEQTLPPSPIRREYLPSQSPTRRTAEMSQRHHEIKPHSPVRVNRSPTRDDARLRPERPRTPPAEEHLAEETEPPSQASQLDIDRSSPQLSLAERTRMSMARFSPTKRDMAPPPAMPSPRKEAADPFAQSPTTPDRIQTLAERTRQSMSLMSAQPKKYPRKSRVSRISNVYPTNQFETPRKAGSYAAETPMFDETLEDMDAEAIFKSRPKIAVSPIMGPSEGFSGIEEMVLEE